jgi:hypothetical protein
MNPETFTAVCDKREVSIDGLEAFFGTDWDGSVSSQLAKVNFTLTPQPRKHGLDSIWIEITDVIASFSWSVDTEDLSQADRLKYLQNNGTEYFNETIQGEVTINSGEDWTIIKDELHFRKDGGFSIDTVEIDFKNHTITVR